MRASQCVESRPRRTVAFFDYATVKNALRSSEELYRLSVSLRNHVLSVSNPVQKTCVNCLCSFSSLKDGPSGVPTRACVEPQSDPFRSSFVVASHKSEVDIPCLRR